MVSISETASRPEVRPALRGVVASAGLSSFLMAAHGLYGASLYAHPELAHVVIPAAFWLLLAVGLASLYAHRPGTAMRWIFVSAVALPYLGIFGLLHGAIGHGLKLILYFAGMAPQRLQKLVDLGDFVVPDDLLFEVTGVGTFFLALLVAQQLLRFLRLSRG